MLYKLQHAVEQHAEQTTHIAYKWRYWPHIQHKDEEIDSTKVEIGHTQSKINMKKLAAQRLGQVWKTAHTKSRKNWPHREEDRYEEIGLT